MRKGDLEGADQALATLASIAHDPEMAATRIWETNTMADILSIAREVLAGELALARDQTDAAIGHFEAAVRVEDALTYVEPSDWYTPARHNLGAALLKAGRAAEAEAVYRRDLEIYPANGWSLVGLEQSLRAQDKGAEAENARRQFEQAWSAADIRIASSRL